MFPPAPVNPSPLLSGLSPGSVPPSMAPGPMGPPLGPGSSGSPADLSVLMGAIRDLGASAESLAAQKPELEPEVQQIRQILRRMIIKAGQSAPQQTTGADLLPMG